MSGTFPCPHCGATYPRSPKLVGRLVRCTGCKQVFVLGEDGIARPDAPAPGPVAPARLTPPASDPSSALQSPQSVPPVKAVAETASSAPPRPDADNAARTGTTRRTVSQRLAKVKTEKFEQQRREMATSLNSVIATAIEQHDSRAEAEQAKKKKAEGQVGEIGPAILTGEGEREARERRGWAVGCAVALVALALVLWLILRHSPEQRALDAFCAGVDQADNRYGRRAPAIMARSVVQHDESNRVVSAPFISLPQVRFQKPRQIPFVKIRPFLAEYAALVRLDQPAGWVKADRRDEIVKFWAAFPNQNLLEDMCRKNGIVLQTTQQIRASLTAGGLDEDSSDLVWFLLTARARANTGTAHPNPIAARLLADALQAEEGKPSLVAIEWLVFSGRKGSLLFDPGAKYQVVNRDFRGRLIRLVEKSGRGSWAVLDLLPETVR